MIEEKEKQAEVKILIAEDEVIVAEDLALCVQDLGYQVAGVASTGEMAIQLAKESKPALVLMDIRLAGKSDGIEASAQIRARIDIPVIFVMGQDETDVPFRAKQTGPYGYLTRPFSPHILKITIEAALYKHQADKRIKESEALHRALVDATDTGYVVLDQDGRVLEANSEYARLTGHKNVQEIIGRSVAEWTAERDKIRNAEAIKKCFSLGCVRNLEIDYQDANGNITPIEINASVMSRDSGTRIVTLCRDITDRKKAEDALRESEEKYRLVVENAQEGIFIAQDGKLRYVNPKVLELLAYSEKEFLSRPMAEFIHPDDREMVLDKHLRRLRGEQFGSSGICVRGPEF